MPSMKIQIAAWEITRRLTNHIFSKGEYRRNLNIGPSRFKPLSPLISYKEGERTPLKTFKHTFKPSDLDAIMKSPTQMKKFIENIGDSVLKLRPTGCIMPAPGFDIATLTCRYTVYDPQTKLAILLEKTPEEKVILSLSIC